MFKQKIGIIGAGEMGQALGRVFVSSLFEVKFWDRDSKHCTKNETLESLIGWTNYIFLCVPSFAVRPVLVEIAPFLRHDDIVICLSKGLEKETQKTMDLVIKEIIPIKPNYALLSGPMLAEELPGKWGGAAIIASPSKSVQARLTELFKPTCVKTQTSDEPTHVATMAVLKNIYSVVVGMAVAQNKGQNYLGFVVEQIVGEMAKIARAKQIDPEIACGLAGIGDLIATGLSCCSADHAAGEALIHRRQPKQRYEAAISLEPLIKLIGGTKGLPILDGLHQIIIDGRDANRVMTKLFG